MSSRSMPVALAPPGDEIARAVLDGGTIRVVAAVTTATAREAVRRHQALGSGALALARGTTAGLLLATLTKDDERVTLQVIGDGPLGSVTVDARSSGGVRAYVKNPVAGASVLSAAQPSLGTALGQHGIISVLRDLGMKETFNGQTSLVSGELDVDVEHYLNTSEQIDSALACDAIFLGGSGAGGDPAGAPPAIAVSGGILVQALPGSTASGFIEQARQALRGGALRRALMTAGPTATAEQVTRAVLDELGSAPESLRVLDVRPVRFECGCSRQRAAGSLALLGSPELASMIVEDGTAEVICNFCHERYQFTETELETIRRESTGPSGPPS